MPKVVILGGGLQGCSTAYYLRELGFEGSITIVERTSVAAAASGKGGGFLAGGWGSKKTSDLHEKSFQLHAELADKLGLTSYRKIPTLEVTGELGLREWPPVEKTQKPIKRSPLHPPWLDATDTKSRLMDDKTAQVVPGELCAKLFEHSGAELKIGTARGLTENGVVVDDEVIEFDKLVVAMGAWSVLLEDWLPGFKLPMEGVYSSSVVYDVPLDNPRALFCAEDSNSCHLEVYPRPDGLYVCGIGGSDHVRGDRLREGGDLQDASLMKANTKRVDAAKRTLAKLAPDLLKDKDPTVVQACMRPCAPDALPLIGPLAADPRLIVATGHNCWGILWAPITGKVVAQLILGHAPDVDLAPFSPDRFTPRASKRGRAMGQQRVGEQW